jgi:hypothetical protein
MKAILKILLSLIVVYWVAVAATFTSIYVFPETAIHIAGAIQSVTEVVQDELPSSSLIEESSEEESSLVEETSDEESSEESSEEIVDEEETTEPEEETEEEIIDEEESDLPESEPAGRLFLNPGEEVVTLEYTQEEITEAVHKVEQFLFESMLTMVPLSFLIIFLNSKFDLYNAEHKEEIAAKKAKKLAAKPVKKAKLPSKKLKLGFKLPSFKLSFKSKKASAPKPAEVKVAPKAKTIKIGLTGIEVKKK